MKIFGRTLFVILCALIIVPLGVFIAADYFPSIHSSSGLGGDIWPPQFCGMLGMLAWCGVFLKSEPTLARIGLGLAFTFFALWGLFTLAAFPA